MKIKKTFAGVFIFSFIIGCAAVSFFVNAGTPLANESEKTVSSVEETTYFIENRRTPKENPFVPEIFGLKDFSDDFDLPKYKLKLVDVLAHHNFYRRDEVIARNGETWLGLFSANGESYLKNTKLKIDPDFAPDYEGAVIQFKESKPIFLLKNAKNLKSGKVTTLFQKNYDDETEFENDASTINQRFFREFLLGDKKYVFCVKNALTKSGETVLALVLESENSSQVITYEPFYEGNYLGSLLWVGDLDDDGKLDFYMNFNDHENGSFKSTLFFSSKAEQGKLVKEVAGFFTAGC